MKNRIDLAKYFAELRFTSGAEIGVANGRYSEILLDSIPELRLILVDPWAVYRGNWRSSRHQESEYQKTQERLSRFSAYTTLMRKTSLEASLEIMDSTLDFVFIDGAHNFDNVMLDILLWSKKVRSGGIVALHDFYNFNNSGIIESVMAYINSHKEIEINLIPRYTGGHPDDSHPCVWWRNP